MIGQGMRCRSMEVPGVIVRDLRCQRHAPLSNGEFRWALCLQPGQTALFWCEDGHYVRVAALTYDEAARLGRSLAEPEVRLLN